MTLLLTEDQSLLYLEGGWEAWAVERDVVEDLARRNVREPVAVVLSDCSAVCFYVDAQGGIV